MAFWTERTVLVTGGAGFLGNHVVKKIQAQGCPAVIVPHSKEFDLRDNAAIIRLLEQARLGIGAVVLLPVPGPRVALRGRFFRQPQHDQLPLE